MPMNNAEGISENLSRGMHMAEEEMSPPPPHPHVSKCSTTSELRKVFENIPGDRNVIIALRLFCLRFVELSVCRIPSFIKC